MSKSIRYASSVALALAWCSVLVAEPVRIRLTITSALPFSNTPLDPTIDFPKFIGLAGADGVLDPNSIELLNVATGEMIPIALTEDFAYSDQGKVEFVVADSNHRQFEIRFQTTARRPSLMPRTFTPQIGTGDLLRYNAGQPRSISVPYAPGLHDLNGDGHLDLTGTWNYAYRPGWPWDGIVCYPRSGTEGFLFGDLNRLRYVTNDSVPPKFFSQIYMAVDFADLNRDGRVDLVTTRSGTHLAEFYLDNGDREFNGLPRFESAGAVSVNGWQGCRVVDLNGDGALDLVVDGQYIRNENPQGWPFLAADSAELAAGRLPCFLDIDQDGRLDAVCLQGEDSVQPDFYRVAWRKNLGGSPPSFAEEQRLPDVDPADISFVSAWAHKGHSGLIVQHRAFQQLSFYELIANRNTKSPRFRAIGRAESLSAVMSLGDQAWPQLCDWDDDGDSDLLVGGGYGWPRIVINRGTQQRPAFGEATRILAEGKPIRFVRNEILGEPYNWHDMGYPYPDFVDWDGDGRRDLVCPNETNRIFWYRNIGSANEPEFGPRRQILCDHYPDSADLRKLSATRAADPKSNNGVYPLERESPFLWRTGAALADFTGDGLNDLVTHDGYSRVATLFVQYRHDDGSLHLRKNRELRLADGKLIDDSIVERRSHWTESFRAVDWNADGRHDLIYSLAGTQSGAKDDGSIYLLRNVGTKTDPVFAEPAAIRCFGEPIRITNHGPHPCPADFDGDGKPDLITCVEWSVYPFYRHAALMMNERPQYTLQLIE